MAVDLDAMRKAREEAKKGNDFLNFKEGDTVLYVCGPCRPEDVLPYIEVLVHRNLGADGKGFHVCLDADKNKVLSHPALQGYLEGKWKTGLASIEGGCPTCEEVISGRVKDDNAKKLRASSSYLWAVIGIKYRPNGTAPWSAVPEAPANTVVPLMCGFQVWDGLMELFGNEGDLTDTKAAIYARVNRKGLKQMDTKYQVQADTDSLRKPAALSKEALAGLNELREGGKADLYKIIAGMVKNRAEVTAMLTGVKLEPDTAESSGEASDRPEGAPPCYGVDIASTDPECMKCPFKADCAAVVGVDVPPDPAPPKAAAKAGGKPTTPPKPAAPAKPAPKAPPRPPPEPEPAEEEPPAEEAAEVEETPAEEVAANTEPMVAAECEVGQLYVMEDGAILEYTGTSKGFAFFKDPANPGAKPVKISATDMVTPAAALSPDVEEGPPADGEGGEEPAEEAAAPIEGTSEDDAALAEMETLLASKKTAAAKAAPSKPAAPAKPAPKPATPTKPAPAKPAPAKPGAKTGTAK